MKNDELKKLLDGLDMAHAERVHSCLRFDLINESLPILIGREKVEPYWRLCDLFIKEKDASVLPLLNAECLKIVEAIHEDIKVGTIKESFLVEAMDRMQKLAGKPVRTCSATLQKELTTSCQEALRTHDISTTFHAIAPILDRIVEQVENGHLDEATGNLLAMFRCLADIQSEHAAWFEHMLSSGEMTDLEFLTDAAVEVYCHLRQRGELSDDWTLDMDAQLLLLNQQTGFFGDWSMSIYADMLYAAEYQSEDYSDLENCEMWMELKECLQEVA